MADPQTSWIDTHPAAAFFVGAYAFTWIISAPAAFMEESWAPWILIYFASFGPPVSAAVVTWLRGDDVRTWARQIVRWNVGWPWWVAAFGIPVGIVAVTTIILATIGARSISTNPHSHLF